MFKAPASEYLVPFDDSFCIEKAPSHDNKNLDDKKQRKQHLGKLDTLQKALYAHDRHSVLLVFRQGLGPPTYGAIKKVTLFNTDGLVARDEQQIAGDGVYSGATTNDDRYLVGFEEGYPDPLDLWALRSDY